MSEDILKIGRVVEVNGSRTIGELEASIDDLYRTYKSRRYAIGQVGSVVKIESGDVLIFGIVTSLRMTEDIDEKKPVTVRDRSESPNAKWIEIALFGQGQRIGLGESDFEFERGISTYPLPGQSIYLATDIELNHVYAKPKKATIKVGSVAQARGIPVHLVTDDLLGKHFAILGTTGSGKSCALALIIQSLIDEYPHAHIILLDPHNEYSKAFPLNAEFVDPTTLEIPHWVLNFEESIELFVGKTEFVATSQTNVLKDALMKARKSFSKASMDVNKITVDTPVPYKIGDLIKNIEKEKAPYSSNKSKSEPYEKILNKIDTLQKDKRFEFLIRPDVDVKDDLDVLLSKLFRIPDNNKPLSIIDLSGVPSDVVNVVVSVLCRAIFDFTLWNPKRKELPLLLVCEEAHRYAPRGKEVAFQPTKHALSRIAKEGRKYGVGLALVSQRPSELSESILSQCNTIISLRMSNDQDQQFVRKALPDSVKSLVDSLSVLRTKEALIVGEGVTVPIRVVFDDIDEDKRPRSENIPFAESWKTQSGNIEAVKETVKRWREQDRSF